METFSSPSLENADYLIPAGTYPVESTWSPRFKKFLPLIKDVPDRDGIRIHKGTIPEHSKGCVLLDLAGMSNITVLFNQLKFNVLQSVADDHDNLHLRAVLRLHQNDHHYLHQNRGRISGGEKEVKPKVSTALKKRDINYSLLIIH